MGQWGSGGTPKAKTPSFYGGDIPWFKIGDLRDGWTKPPEQTITELGLSQSSAKIVPENTLLVAMYGSIGKLGMTSFPCATNQAIAFCIPCLEKVELKWLFYFLLGRRSHLLSLGKGGTQQNISQTVLLQESVPVPPLDTQRRIVARIDELFSELDDGEAALARARADLETYRKSLLKAAVTGELTADWRAANPPAETGEQLLQRLLADRKARWEADPKNKGKRYPEPVLPELDGLPSIPESWAWVSPDVLSDAGKGQLVIGPFGSNLKVTDYCADGVPLVFVRHIRSADFSGLKPQFVSASKAQELKSHWCSPGDVLITKMGDPPGDAALYPEGLPTAVITADCIRWRTSEAVRPNFAVTWINSHVGRTWIQRMTKGVAQQKISLEVFRGMPVAVPPLDEQDALLKELENMMPGASDLGSAVADLELRSAASRQSILAAAFRGELVQ